jgi:hypothetical protein
VIFLGDFSFVRIFLTENYRVTMTTSSVVGIPTGGTFIPRDISVGILKPRGCSYDCDTGVENAPCNRPLIIDHWAKLLSFSFVPEQRNYLNFSYLVRLQYDKYKIKYLFQNFLCKM